MILKLRTFSEYTFIEFSDLELYNDLMKQIKESDVFDKKDTEPSVVHMSDLNRILNAKGLRDKYDQMLKTKNYISLKKQSRPRPSPDKETEEKIHILLKEIGGYEPRVYILDSKVPE